MATPYLGEIKIVSFNFPPKGWALCNGALLPINQNQALFSLFGTQFGGDGRTTFGLPNLQARVPVHVSNAILIGQLGGEFAHTLTINELPLHLHPVAANSGSAASDGENPTPTRRLAASTGANLYAPLADATAMATSPPVVTSVGGSQPHTNAQPYLVLNFVVALQGIFPSRN